MKYHEQLTIGMMATEPLTGKYIRYSEVYDTHRACAIGAMTYVQALFNDLPITKLRLMGENKFGEFRKFDWDNVAQALEYLLETRPNHKMLAHCIRSELRRMERTDIPKCRRLATLITSLNDNRYDIETGTRLTRHYASRLLVLAILRYLDI